MQNQDLYNVAELEIVYRRASSLLDFPPVKCSKTAADYFMKSWNMDTIEYFEQFKILLLDTSGKPLGIVDITSGGITSLRVDLRRIFGAALKANATSFIAAHNHPSGSLQPSSQDIALTNEMLKAGTLLDIKLRDHLILTSKTYYSLLDNDLM